MLWVSCGFFLGGGFVVLLFCCLGGVVLVGGWSWVWFGFVFGLMWISVTLRFFVLGGVGII